MAGDSSKPAIPAWQRSSPAQPDTSADQPPEKAGSDAPGTVDPPASAEEKSDQSNGNEESEAEESSPPDSGTSQLQMVEAFLSDPKVKDEPMEKKRAFLERKEVPVETIEQVLAPGKPAATFLEASDLTAFKDLQRRETHQQARLPVQSPSQSQAASAPPIITYPEFLVDAHKPAPLVTPTRVLNAAYFAAGLATLLYGASNFVVTPMIGSLTEARHELSEHSKDKVDELNERLSKIVSKVPEKVSLSPPEIEVDEADSMASDPTELYHRDMGTQTSPLPSRRSSDPDTSLSSLAVKRDMVEYQTNGLGILQSHMDELLDGAKKQEATNKERQDGMNKLRHYLDKIMYGNSHSSVWDHTEDTLKTPKPTDNSAVEDLKKEIRGVKGVLLSARRFPGAGMTRASAGA